MTSILLHYSIFDIFFCWKFTCVDK